MIFSLFYETLNEKKQCGVKKKTVHRYEEKLLLDLVMFARFPVFAPAAFFLSECNLNCDFSCWSSLTLKSRPLNVFSEVKKK